MWRFLAAVISQAPGLDGTPVSGHFSSAASSASWARSSARPRSRTIRVSPAMSRADSILQTASMAACASRATGLALLALDLLAQAVLLLAQLGGVLLAEVLG